MKTKQRIVKGALELFNLHGERNITTNHISEYLGISPGNLYYHYSNKQEIIRAIFEDYTAELLDRFRPYESEDESLVLLKHYVNSTFSLMWKYRFFYANLADIVSRDAQLHSAYSKVQEKLRVNLVAIVESFSTLELISVEPQDMPRLVTNLHFVATGWLGYQSAMNATHKVTESMIMQGMLQILAMVKPVATKTGKEQLLLLEQGLEMTYAVDGSK
ncbi:TetR family transcriptional regulator [Vibrio sp. UCD-FRSSP16_10]|uniref:TetR/AcrR family transcriptional regulator n=1 Tax=unclassified Vibrio TaxID=2614977 RepID=UPI0008011C2D|nr:MULTISPECIES: TetR/AcrR family transcriptional regulator [unclassified Vibrio]OBT16398.1 TetR family transcriptional regulator [Vibrio sp. UCD-FRSSP16_30]OBT21262.1 TetR family transcriptional regulator [Vibrio sp. UCD-FRSSP16_10]